MGRKKVKKICEICGEKTYYLGFSHGKHLCGKCEYFRANYGYIGKNIKKASLF